MSKISKKKLLEKYHRRFANGEQYLELDLQRKTIVEKDKDYYWQEKSVYNHILPIIKTIAKDLDESLIYGENGLVALLIPYQKAYNAIKNREMEYINRQSTGILCVEDGSVDTDAIAEDGLVPGKIIVYRQGSVPPTISYTDPKVLETINEQCNAIYNEMLEIVRLFILRCCGNDIMPNLAKWKR